MVAATLHHESAPQGAEQFASARRWLLLLILLVFAMVLVGGATRLTESGLSITEWNLVTGTIPPLGDAAWQAEFERYRESPQYKILNEGMSLADFTTIYWWEWTHRELGRFIGVVYIAGFLWLVARRHVSFNVGVALAAMGLLLGAQGIVGWIMVASGLEPGMTAVAPLRLMLHLVLASLFFAALVAMFVRLEGAASEPASSVARAGAWLLVILAFVQIAVGGLMAGHDAGLTYNTWPLMDGNIAPRGLLLLEPVWRNVVENIATFHFGHRLGAYMLAAAILVHAIALRRAPAAQRSRAFVMALLVLAQIVLGIATLLHNVPVALALMHQGFALILLLTLVWNAAVLRPPA